MNLNILPRTDIQNSFQDTVNILKNIEKHNLKACVYSTHTAGNFLGQRNYGSIKLNSDMGIAIYLPFTQADLEKKDFDLSTSIANDFFTSLNKNEAIINILQKNGSQYSKAIYKVSNNRFILIEEEVLEEAIYKQSIPHDEFEYGVIAVQLPLDIQPFLIENLTYKTTIPFDPEFLLINGLYNTGKLKSFTDLNNSTSPKIRTAMLFYTIKLLEKMDLVNLENVSLFYRKSNGEAGECYSFSNFSIEGDIPEIPDIYIAIKGGTLNGNPNHPLHSFYYAIIKDTFLYNKLHSGVQSSEAVRAREAFDGSTLIVRSKLFPEGMAEHAIDYQMDDLKKRWTKIKDRYILLFKDVNDLDIFYLFIKFMSKYFIPFTIGLSPGPYYNHSNISILKLFKELNINLSDFGVTTPTRLLDAFEEIRGTPFVYYSNRITSVEYYQHEEIQKALIMPDSSFHEMNVYKTKMRVVYQVIIDDTYTSTAWRKKAKILCERFTRQFNPGKTRQRFLKIVILKSKDRFQTLFFKKILEDNRNIHFLSDYKALFKQTKKEVEVTKTEPEYLTIYTEESLKERGMNLNPLKQTFSSLTSDDVFLEYKSSKSLVVIDGKEYDAFGTKSDFKLRLWFRLFKRFGKRLVLVSKVNMGKITGTKFDDFIKSDEFKKPLYFHTMIVDTPDEEMYLQSLIKLNNYMYDQISDYGTTQEHKQQGELLLLDYLKNLPPSINEHMQYVLSIINFNKQHYPRYYSEGIHFPYILNWGRLGEIEKSLLQHHKDTRPYAFEKEVVLGFLKRVSQTFIRYNKDGFLYTPNIKEYVLERSRLLELNHYVKLNKTEFDTIKLKADENYISSATMKILAMEANIRKGEK